jgi:hypothetical protein
MKRIFLVALFILPSLSFCQSNDWMTSLDAAKRLALIQNKMILMTWEESMLYPLPVTIKDSNGKPIFIDDLFQSDYLVNLLREHFILVKVNESEYPTIIDGLEEKRSTVYINKLNDESMKVMDANGTIVNTTTSYREYLNLAVFIQNYAVNTDFINAELKAYSTHQNFATAFRLSVKYLEMACYVNKKAKEEFVNVSDIYLKEAKRYLIKEAIDNKQALLQKIELQQLEQELLLGNPKKTLRKLNRLDPIEIDNINKTLVSFLYFTSYIILKDEMNAAPYRSKISLVDIKRANAIINTFGNP